MVRATSLQDVKLLKDLRLIAFRCGLRRELTKPKLLSHLQQHVQRQEPPLQDARILSIDMGIKNFSYALLLYRTEPNVAQKYLRRQRYALGAHEIEYGSYSGARSLANQQDPAAEYSNRSMASAASEIINEHLLVLKPTHILIENQRSRSAGSSAVSEWVLRVNKFEAMLFAILTELKFRGHWGGQIVSTCFQAASRLSAPRISLTSWTRILGTGTIKRTKHSAEVAGALRIAESSAKRRAAKEIKKHKIDMVGVDSGSRGSP